MGYHVLTNLTHEALINEISTINHLRNSRVDSVLISICSENRNNSHLSVLEQIDIPVVFFDRLNEASSFAKDGYYR